MRIITVINQKGGCGKTTTSVNLAAAFAQIQHRLLVVDLDAQAHATLGLGLSPDGPHRTIYNVITNPHIPISSILQRTTVEGLDLIPSNILLSGVISKLLKINGRESVLRRRLEELRDNYDICIIDCASSLSILSLNALVACTEIIIPVQTHYYALEGLKQLLETIDVVKVRFNPSLRILGMLLTFVENRTRLSREVEGQMREYFDDLVFDTVIHRNIRLAEAPSTGESILTYDPKCRGANEYLSLAHEITYGTKNRTTQTNLVNI